MYIPVFIKTRCSIQGRKVIMAYNSNNIMKYRCSNMMLCIYNCCMAALLNIPKLYFKLYVEKYKCNFVGIYVRKCKIAEIQCSKAGDDVITA